MAHVTGPIAAGWPTNGFDTAGPVVGSSMSAGFSALERLVIAIARQDSLSSLDAPGRIRALLGAIFGTRPGTRLADKRLEALRRMAVLAWHCGASVPVGETGAFIAAGFTSHHRDALLAGAGRSFAASPFSSGCGVPASGQTD